MSKMYTSFTREDGRTITEEHNPNANVGLSFFVLMLIALAAVVIVAVIYETTGVNVFDSLEGITGPCGTCTPEVP